MENVCYQCFHSSLNELGICTVCGYDNAKNRESFPLALPAGSILYGRYIVGKVLGQGGFGITYLAQDYQTQGLVAIKEFFPDTMATRTGATTVTPFSGMRGENFDYGKTSFLDEAQTMAQFNGNPNIAGVQMYFEENGTAYFVMEYIDGCSFESYIKQHGGKLSWDETLKVMLPVLDALSEVHEKGIIHRDVTPDNIYITKDGTVKLLDFGAARYSLGNVSRSLDVILKHGFAPKEQYKRHGRQGPYTDVYAASASIYFAITGTRPDDSIERSDEDTLPLPSTLGAKLTQQQENVVLKGLAVNPEDRYQSAAELKQALTVQPKKAIKEEPKKDEPKKSDDRQKTVEIKLPEKIQLPKWVIPVAAAVLAILLLIVVVKPSDKASKPSIDVPATTESIVQEAEVHTMMEVSSPMVEMKISISDDGWSETCGKCPIWGQDQYARDEVKSVTFTGSLSHAPDDAWDVSAAKDSSIMAWLEDGALTVASDGIIALNENASYLFQYFLNVESIDFGTCVDTSNVTDMYAMFDSCKKLTFLNVSGFDTANVTNMSNMFEGCESLTELDLSGFNTSNVTDMSYMFSGCESLTALDVSGFNTSSVTDMACMFTFCEALTTLDLSGFDTSNVTDMTQMFRMCMSLTKLNLSNFDTSNVTDMLLMFSFSGEIDLNCSDSKILTQYEANTRYKAGGTKDHDTRQTFVMQKGSPMDEGFWGTTYNRDDVERISFRDSKDGAPEDAFDMSEAGDGSVLGWMEGSEFIVAADGKIAPTPDAFNWFANNSNLKSIDFGDCFDTSNVTNMHGMFYRCLSLTELDLSCFDTSNVKNMYGMFNACESLTSLNLSGFDTSSVANMSGMFYNCTALSKLDMSGFDTSNVTDMSNMFSGCESLTALDLSAFHTPKLKDMDGMFHRCKSLVRLDLSNFDSANVEYLNIDRLLFLGCDSLTNLKCNDVKILNKYKEQAGS